VALFSSMPNPIRQKGVSRCRVYITRARRLSSFAARRCAAYAAQAMAIVVREFSRL
jgi:hypothetical protein